MFHRKIDRYKTSQAVKDFFKTEYPELAIKASIAEAYPKSPVLRDISVQETRIGNSEERKLTEYLLARELFKGVDIALDQIKQVDDISAGIVRLSYIEKLSVPVVCDRLMISDRNYFRKLDNALIFFASAYAPWIDLRKWQ